MSEWNYSLGEVMSGDEFYLVPRYPRHVAQAFIAVSYDIHEIVKERDDPWVPYHLVSEEAILSFAQRWGGLDDAVFLRALQEAKGRDRLAAIFALGHNSALAHAMDLLAPFLTSSDQLERCAAACMYALRRDGRALPVLKEYLLHGPPEDEQGRSLSEAEIWYASYRCHIAGLLATWGPSSLVWMLRQSLAHLWELEEQNGGSVYDQETQDALCYALGRRGALGALHGIGLPAQRKRIALVYLALGYVRANERFEDLSCELLLNRELKQEIATVLAEQFALSAEESAETVASFADDIRRRRDAASGLGEWDDTPIIFEGPASIEKVKEALGEFRKRRAAAYAETSGLEEEDEPSKDDELAARARDREAVRFYQQDIEKRRAAVYGLGKRDETPRMVEHIALPEETDMRRERTTREEKG